MHPTNVLFHPQAESSCETASIRVYDSKSQRKIHFETKVPTSYYEGLPCFHLTLRTKRRLDLPKQHEPEHVLCQRVFRDVTRVILPESGRDLMMEVLCRCLPSGAWEDYKYLSPNNQCPGLDSNGVPPQYKPAFISTWAVLKQAEVYCPCCIKWEDDIAVWWWGHEMFLKLCSVVGVN